MKKLGLLPLLLISLLPLLVACNSEVDLSSVNSGDGVSTGGETSTVSTPVVVPPTVIPSTVTPTITPDKGLDVIEGTAEHAPAISMIQGNKYYDADGKAKNVVRILSLDGGGIRGLSELFVLSYIEAYTGYKVSELFSVIGGTSIGGFSVLPLTAPDERDPTVAKFQATDVLQSIYKYCDKVFVKDKSLWSLFGLKDAKYSTEGMEEIVSAMLGWEVALKDTVVDASVFSLNLDSTYIERLGTESRFSTTPVGAAMLATAAASTYFESLVIVDDSGNANNFADGGIGANNPSLNLVHRATEKYDNEISNTVFEVYSIGSGEEYPSKPDLNMGVKDVSSIVGLFFAAERHLHHDQLVDMVKFDGFSTVGSYNRIQYFLDEALLNDTSVEYRSYLVAETLKMIESPVFVKMLGQLPRKSENVFSHNEAVDLIKKKMIAIRYNEVGYEEILALDLDYLASSLFKANKTTRKLLLQNLYHGNGSSFSNSERVDFLKNKLTNKVKKYDASNWPFLISFFTDSKNRNDILKLINEEIKKYE